MLFLGFRQTLKNFSLHNKALFGEVGVPLHKTVSTTVIGDIPGVFLEDCMTSVTKEKQPSQSDDEVSLNVLSSSNNIFLALKKKQKDLITTADHLKCVESTIITPVLSMAQIQAKCRVASTRRVFSRLESCGHVLLTNLEPCLPFITLVNLFLLP